MVLASAGDRLLNAERPMVDGIERRFCIIGDLLRIFREKACRFLVWFVMLSPLTGQIASKLPETTIRPNSTEFDHQPSPAAESTQ